MRRMLGTLSRWFMVMLSVLVVGYVLFMIYSYFGDIRGLYFREGDWQMFIIVAAIGFLLTTLFNHLLKWELHAELGQKPGQRIRRIRRRGNN